MRFYIFTLLVFLVACSPKPYVTAPDPYEEDNPLILKEGMSDSLYQATKGRHVKRSDRVVKTEQEAFEIAKLKFQEEFGYNEDIMDRLYAIHLVDGFWIVKGMLPPGFNGGTIVAVIDSESGELLYTLHWR